IEFRDSLILSGLSLAKTAENLTLPEHQNIKKLVDGLEYGKVRHHETILTEKELEYCKNDILVILAFIKEQMLFNKDIRKIPMTNTGYVRRHVRNECLFNNNNHKKSSSGKKSRYLEMMKNMLMTETDYNNLGCAFMGGFTHASIFHIDCKLKNVSSIDLTSSYPTVMVAEKFPMGSARREKGIRTVKELKHLAKTKCFIAEVEFINIQNELVYESYFSKSKCKTLENPTVINGRVFEADRLITIITDVDLETIEQVYSWDAVIIHKVYSFWKDYLPKEIIKSILDLYKDK
ncbi:DNA polymerase, partial [Herbiconiux daphne]